MTLALAEQANIDPARLIEAITQLKAMESSVRLDD